MHSNYAQLQNVTSIDLYRTMKGRNHNVDMSVVHQVGYRVCSGWSSFVLPPIKTHDDGILVSSSWKLCKLKLLCRSKLNWTSSTLIYLVLLRVSEQCQNRLTKFWSLCKLSIDSRKFCITSSAIGYCFWRHIGILVQNVFIN